MRSLLTTALEVAGFALVTIAAGMVWLPLGLFTAGASCILVGYLLGRAA